MRYAAKRDTTEAAIVQALRTYGCTVVPLSQRGIPDLLIKTPDGHAHLVECKDAHGTLTPDQRAFMRVWGPVPVLRSVDEAVRWVIGACARAQVLA
jgi:hypothetical protein